MPEFVSGNQITLLENGTEFFPVLIDAIDQATREIYLETYICEYDDTGRMVLAALMSAARRGVTVHMLIDGFGSRLLPKTVLADLEASGVQLRWYRPEISRWRLRRHRLRRLHRKLAVVDTRIGFVGGINIIDDMDTPGQAPPRYDYAVAVEGPLVGHIHHAAKRLWTLVSWSQLKLRKARKGQARLHVPPRGKMRGALVIRDNIGHRRDIEDAYLEAFAQAKEEILIANAYFLPGLRFREALRDAAARGVRVVLLLQGRVEYMLLHYASRALYRSFLDAGIEIHEYHKSFMHSKVAVVDRTWATVGSSNIDPFSLLLAREANVVVDDVNFAEKLRSSLEAAMMGGARQVLLYHWELQPWHQRFMSWLSYGLVRVMMGAVGYANH